MKWNREAEWIVFTDLDGTLLDHDTYQFSDAQAALEMLAEKEIPLVINTSKTFEEILQIRQRLGNDHPFIGENGSFVAVPENYFSTGAFKSKEIKRYRGMQVELLGGGRDEILAALDTIRSEHNFKYTGFEDMSAAGLAQLTGLSEKEAGLAKQRLSTEPILWQDDEAAWKIFENRLKSEGLQWVQGGRFISISRPYDKKDGVIRLLECYRSVLSENLKTVGLGDSPNDQGMLDMMTIAVIIASSRSDEIRLKHPQQVIRTSEKGPKGWQSAMETIFKFIK